MTDAPVDLDHLQSYCDAAARLPGATAIGVDSRELARLIAEVRAARSAPPADEVAELLGPECEHGLRNCFECPGLERDMLQVRRWIGTPDDEDLATENEAGHTLTIEALDRLENHLKGKR